MDDEMMKAQVARLEDLLRQSADYVQDAVERWPAGSLECEGALAVQGRVNAALEGHKDPEMGSLQAAIVAGAPNVEPPCPECGQAPAPDTTLSRHAFVNRCRSLFNIDGDQLPELEGGDWISFRDDPVRYFMRAGETQAAAIWREVEKRQSVRS